MSTDTIELAAVLASNERPHLTEVLARPGTRVVLLAGSKDPNAKATLILLDDYGPAFVVKVPTTAQAQRVVQHEGMILAALAERALGPLATSLPRTLGYMSVEGLLALVSTAVTGTPMTVRYHGWRHTASAKQVRRDFAAAGSWLADMQTRTAGPRAPITLVDNIEASIEQRFAIHPDLPSVRLQLAAAGARLARATTPRTVVHGDYWFGNLLLDERRNAVIGVVDWESGELAGEPLRDVARFAVSYALYLDRHTRANRPVAGHGRGPAGLRAGDWGSGVIHALREKTWFGEVVATYLRTALVRLGAPPWLWREVLLVGIADVAATADHPDFALAHFELFVRASAIRPVDRKLPATPMPTALPRRGVPT